MQTARDIILKQVSELHKLGQKTRILLMQHHQSASNKQGVLRHPLAEYFQYIPTVDVFGVTSLLDNDV